MSYSQTSQTRLKKIRKRSPNKKAEYTANSSINLEEEFTTIEKVSSIILERLKC